ncbi:MAG TPA: hypothetical protein VGA99_05805, partial [bacterium]
MKNVLQTCFISLICLTHSVAGERSALEVARAVADKIVRESAFEFELVPQTPVLGIQVVDFRQTFGGDEPGVAYALSYIMSEKDSSVTFGVSSSDAIKIWINDRVVFQHAASRSPLAKEIAYGLVAFQDTFAVPLHAGSNRILMKVASRRAEFIALLRSINHAVGYTLDPVMPDASSSWLCLGPFSVPVDSEWSAILDTEFFPETGFEPIYYDRDRS